MVTVWAEEEITSSCCSLFLEKTRHESVFFLLFGRERLRSDMLGLMKQVSVRKKEPIYAPGWNVYFLVSHWTVKSKKLFLINSDFDCAWQSGKKRAHPVLRLDQAQQNHWKKTVQRLSAHHIIERETLHHSRKWSIRKHASIVHFSLPLIKYLGDITLGLSLNLRLNLRFNWCISRII